MNVENKARHMARQHTGITITVYPLTNASNAHSNRSTRFFLSELLGTSISCPDMRYPTLFSWTRELINEAKRRGYRVEEIDYTV